MPWRRRTLVIRRRVEVRRRERERRRRGERVGKTGDVRFTRHLQTDTHTHN